MPRLSFRDNWTVPFKAVIRHKQNTQSAYGFGGCRELQEILHFGSHEKVWEHVWSICLHHQKIVFGIYGSAPFASILSFLIHAPTFDRWFRPLAFLPFIWPYWQFAGRYFSHCLTDLFKAYCSLPDEKVATTVELPSHLNTFTSLIGQTSDEIKKNKAVPREPLLGQRIIMN